VPNAQIRLFRPEDLPRLCEIAVRAWEPVFADYCARMGDEMFEAVFGPDWRAEKSRQIEDFCQKQPQCCLVSELDGQVVGFITYYLKRDRQIGEIGNNAIDPDCQGQGLGTEQYRAVLEACRLEGMRFVAVTTGLDPAHAPARAAYEKAGFKQMVPMVEYYQRL